MFDKFEMRDLKDLDLANCPITCAVGYVQCLHRLRWTKCINGVKVLSCKSTSTLPYSYFFMFIPSFSLHFLNHHVTALVKGAALHLLASMLNSIEICRFDWGKGQIDPHNLQYTELSSSYIALMFVGRWWKPLFTAIQRFNWPVWVHFRFLWNSLFLRRWWFCKRILIDNQETEPGEVMKMSW